MKNDDTKNDILVVDDSKSVVQLIKYALQDYNVRTATSGEDALTTVEDYTPDLVLLDVKMPGMDGYKVCREIKSNKRLPYVKVIMVSGETDLRDRLMGYESGADDYITKPIELKELMAKVKVFLRIKTLEDQLHEMNDNLNDQIRMRTDQLIESEKMAAIGKHAAGIVHNMNNPLQALMAHAEMLTMDYPDNKHIKSLLKAAESMKLMIKTILTNASLVNRSHPVEIDFNKLLADQVELLKADQFFKHEVGKKLNLKSLPVYKGTYSHFTQSLGNLIKNAVEAMHDSKERVLEISTSSYDEMIYIAISDTGHGIALEYIDRIFDPFYTTKPLLSLKGRPTGTGLGLASTKEMIESYKGKILVESEVGKGSVFKVCLPINN